MCTQGTHPPLWPPFASARGQRNPQVVERRDGTEFSVILMLTALYQETARSDVRRALCRAFHAMGHMLPDVHDVLQDTSLPLEIARDVKERGILGKDSEEDVNELEEALSLAVVLLGHGDALPALDLEYVFSFPSCVGP
jgi:hypothetical protein